VPVNVRDDVEEERLWSEDASEFVRDVSRGFDRCGVRGSAAVSPERRRKRPLTVCVTGNIKYDELVAFLFPFEAVDEFVDVRERGGERGLLLFSRFGTDRLCESDIVRYCSCACCGRVSNWRFGWKQMRRGHGLSDNWWTASKWQRRVA